jgi:hypothetical protein
MIPSWMKQLSNEKESEEFSQLCHDYYKLATMRIMQVIREKFNVPKEDIPTLTLCIFARMLNESVYSVGANIKENYSITDFYCKKHLLNLVKVLNGEPLNPLDRDDIEVDIQKGLDKFKEFVLKNGRDFCLH